MPIVTENGFQPVGHTRFIAIDALAAADAVSLDIDGGTPAEALTGEFGRIELIRIRFDDFADGRGFSLARRLRDAGFRGRLRASGHVISDQFRYALACGFDDVEISDELAARQPEDDWIADVPVSRTYREKLTGAPVIVRQVPATRLAAEKVFVRRPPYQSVPGVHEQTVTSVTHYTDGLFSFRISRPASFRFRSGEFAMIGLPNAERPVFRAYSLAGPAWDDELEFYSIKVPGGPLTQHLQHIAVGDTVLLKKKATGTLVLDALLPGNRLFLFSTGTGIAPFASIIRDPETYGKFDQVVLTQTCRTQAELGFGAGAVAQTRAGPLTGGMAGTDRLVHFTTLTREQHIHTGRITSLLNDGGFFKAIGAPPISPAQDRAMLCGSTAMLRDTREICESAGLTEGSNSRPGTYLVERAFVD